MTGCIDNMESVNSDITGCPTIHYTNMINIVKLALMASVMVLTSCTNTGHDNMVAVVMAGLTLSYALF